MDNQRTSLHTYNMLNIYSTGSFLVHVKCLTFRKFSINTYKEITHCAISTVLSPEEI